MSVSENIGPANAMLRVEMTPGVMFPDWSAVTSETVRRGLEGIFERQDTARRWDGLDDDEDRVRRAILQHYLEAGYAPLPDDLARATGLDAGPVVERLNQRDIVALDDATRAITGAYPFTDRHSGHQVHVGATTVNAMCAIDALGIGAMCGRDVTITSTCARCAAPIGVVTSDRGRALEAVSPPDTVVWLGLAYEDGCAANSLCRGINFYCSDDHLEAEIRGDMAGHRLSLDEALEAGRAIFTPMLATGTGS
jgi:hypothetical protein